ncbi:hypothetical protein ACVW17_000824 [Bradyrhizobium sp. USDA 4473]
MSITDRSSSRKSIVRLPQISEMTLLIAIAVGFLVLHLLTATLLMPAATADAAVPQDARVIHTD